MPIHHKDQTQQLNQVEPTNNQEQSSPLIVDNRPEAQLGRELQDKANNSPQAQEGAQLKASAKDKADKEGPKRKVNKTGIPDRLKAVVEHFSGFSLDEVRVHYNSDKPALINAHAYAEGFNIYIGPGQEKHLAHEVWHVVQQMKGEVSATTQVNGNQNIHSLDSDPVSIRKTFEEGRTLNGILITYKKKGIDGYYKFEFPNGTIERKQPAEVEFFFRDIGIKTFLQGVLEEHFSKEASLFLLALGIHESGFAQGNGGEEYHNMFSIMGGNNNNLSTSSGALQKFDSWESGFSDGLVAQIIDGEDAKANKKFPLLRQILESNDFTIDHLNQAFGQFDFHKHNKNDKSAPYSYDSNKEVNFGLKYAKIAVNRVIPMLEIDLYRRIQDLQELQLTSSPEQQTLQLHHIHNYSKGIELLQTAKQNIEAKILNYEKNHQ